MKHHLHQRKGESANKNSVLHKREAFFVNYGDGTATWKLAKGTQAFDGTRISAAKLEGVPQRIGPVLLFWNGRDAASRLTANETSSKIKRN